MLVTGIPSQASILSSRPAIAVLVAILLLSFFFFSYVSIPAGPWQSPKNPALSGESSHGFLPIDLAQEVCTNRRLDVYQSRHRHRKVFDLFFVNAEMDWVDIRLNELHSHVDYFVILEAKETFRGSPKPLYVKEHWARFQAFHDQIIYKEVNFTGIKFKDAWAREEYQRNALYHQVIPFLEGERKPEINDVLIVGVRNYYDYPQSTR